MERKQVHYRQHPTTIAATEAIMLRNAHLVQSKLAEFCASLATTSAVHEALQLHKKLVPHPSIARTENRSGRLYVEHEPKIPWFIIMGTAVSLYSSAV